MNLGAASLVRLYLNANDRAGQRLLYEVLVMTAREMGLAGASVFPAEVGYGSHRVIHDAMSEYTFADAPLVVEVVDREERTGRWLAECARLVADGLATVSTVNSVKVVRYVHPNDSGGTADAD